jgi:hypothetical protein
MDQERMAEALDKIHDIALDLLNSDKHGKLPATVTAGLDAIVSVSRYRFDVTKGEKRL